MKNPQTKERPPIGKVNKDKTTIGEDVKPGAPDIILGHKRTPSAQRRRSHPGARRSQSRGGVPEAQRLSRGGSEVRESSVEMEEVVVRKFSSTSEQQKSVDRLSRVVAREKRTCEGEIKKGNHCQERSRSGSPEKRSPSIRRKAARSLGRTRPEKNGKRISESQKENFGPKADIGRSRSVNRGGIGGGTGKLSGVKSNSSGPTPKTKILKTADGELTSPKRKEEAFKGAKECKSELSTDVIQGSKKVVTEADSLQENGVVEESISASEAIIR